MAQESGRTPASQSRRGSSRASALVAARPSISRATPAFPGSSASTIPLTTALRISDRSPGTADGPEEVKRVVREQADAGADVIKMYGSTGSGRDVSGTQTFTFEAMQAACDTAHALGKRIAIHSYGPDGARDAVRAGADSLEHATDMDDATIAEMARRKIFYVPTIDHNRYYADNYRLLNYPPQAVDDLNAFIRRNLETARKAFR